MQLKMGHPYGNRAGKCLALHGLNIIHCRSNIYWEPWE